VLRDALLFLEDIEKSCDRIVRYTAGRSREEIFPTRSGSTRSFSISRLSGKRSRSFRPSCGRNIRPSPGARSRACETSSPMPISLSTSRSSGMRSSAMFPPSLIASER